MPIDVKIDGQKNQNDEFCLLTLIDITDRKQAEQDILKPRKSRRKRRKIYYHSHGFANRKNGQITWVEVSTKFRYSPTGDMEVVGASRNMDEKEKAEEALRQSEAIKNTMVSNIGDVIVIIDQNELNQFKSPNVTKLFGGKPEEQIGKSIRDTIHPDDLEAGKPVRNNRVRYPD